MPADKWTVDDFLFAEEMGGVSIAPQGDFAVWSKSSPSGRNGEPVSHLFLRNLAADFEIQLTRGAADCWSPRFAPDGRRIAFLSSSPEARDGEAPEISGPQFWLIDPRGGAPWRPLALPRGVAEFAWIDSERLLLVMEEDPDAPQQAIAARKDTSIIVEDKAVTPPVRLFRLDLGKNQLTRLTTNEDWIEQIAVSPAGRHAVAVHRQSLRYEYDHKIKPAMVLHDLQSGTAKRLAFPRDLAPGSIAWRPDDAGFYFSAPESRHPYSNFASVRRLYYHDVAAGTTDRVDLDWPRGLAATSDGFLALLADGCRPKLARYRKEQGGWRRSWVSGKHAGNIFSFVLSRDGRRIAYEHSTASKPRQWSFARLESEQITEERIISPLNPGWERKSFARTEIIRWKGANDEEVEGILYHPGNRASGERRPLVVIIHGGPDYVDRDEFDDGPVKPANLLAQRGAFVLKVNYHGSTEYGPDWVASITDGRYNGAEIIDIESGVDALIARGLADPERLALLGWSNGAILAIELTTRTARYKAAAVGAGDVNWFSDWRNCRYGHAFNTLYLGGTPFDAFDVYARKSAFFRLDKVRTPTLILFGTEDRDVPTEQGWQHFRALQHFGRAEVRFVLLPGERHRPSKPQHRRRVLEEQLAWLDRHLFGAASREEHLRPGSPLAALRARKEMDVVPPTVTLGQIKLGRFEVTRRQFAAFHAEYKFSPGTAEHPANGVTYAEAKAYCRWLSSRTGHPYRLPRLEEMERLQHHGMRGNTLDYWAGYAVNPDDYEKLLPWVREAGPEELLFPVGVFADHDASGVSDLHGNVAEWATDDRGSGVPFGQCAGLPADPKSRRIPSAEFVGFRVVLDEEPPGAGQD